MNKINVGRVLLGGLLAGVVLNIGEFLLNGVLLAEEMKSFFTDRNLPPEPSPSFYVTATVGTLILGVVIVLLYAAIRPRFGPGVKTAIWAGVIAWFCVYVYIGALYASMGMVSTGLTVKGAVWGLFEYAIAAIAGAWLYKEDEAKPAMA
jgi:hypothetical protein